MENFKIQQIYTLLQQLEAKPIYNKYDNEINAMGIKIQKQSIAKFYKILHYKSGTVSNIVFFKRKLSVIDYLKSNYYSKLED